MKPDSNDVMLRDSIFAWIALGSLGILLIPLFAMQVTTEVRWGLVDFIIMGALLFGTGSLFVLAARRVARDRRVIVGIVFLAAFLFTWAGLAVGAAADDPLMSQIDYRFVGHLEETDDEGRLLVWEANIDGGFTGTMRWWFADPPPVDNAVYGGGRMSFYAARWEILVQGKRVLAGISTGKTNFPDGADGIWDGHGRVTEAATGYEALVGRRVYESGTVVLGAEPPVSFTGTGVFAIY